MCLQNPSCLPRCGAEIRQSFVGFLQIPTTAKTPKLSSSDKQKLCASRVSLQVGVFRWQSRRFATVLVCSCDQKVANQTRHSEKASKSRQQVYFVQALEVKHHYQAQNIHKPCAEQTFRFGRLQ